MLLNPDLEFPFQIELDLLVPKDSESLKNEVARRLREKKLPTWCTKYGIGMEVEEYGHCLKVGERSSEEEDDEEIEGLDDLREGAVNTKRITHIPITLESSEQGTQYEDGDAEVFTSLISSDSDFEVGFLPFKKRKRVHVYKLNSSLCFRQIVVEVSSENLILLKITIFSQFPTHIPYCGR